MTAHSWSRHTVAIVMTVASCVMAAPSSASQPGASRPAAEPVRQAKLVPHLRANASNVERYVVRGVCERDGIRQISEILKRSEFEEMWAFLPRANGTRDCEWHEIGREEKSAPRKSTLRVDMNYLMGLMAENAEIHLLHFHPLKYFECAGHDECPKQAGSSRPGPVDARWITDLVFSMPSPSDVHFMMNVTSRYSRRTRGQGTIVHKVVTPYGIVDYGVTDEGLARYDSERNGRTEGLYISRVAASRLDNDRVEQVIREHPGSLTAAVPRLAETLNTAFLRVLYSPAFQ